MTGGEARDIDELLLTADVLCQKSDVAGGVDDKEEPYWKKRPNIAPIKEEYVIWNKPRSSGRGQGIENERVDEDSTDRPDDDHATGNERGSLRRSLEEPENPDSSSQLPPQRIKLSGSQKRKLALQQKREKRQHKKANGSGTNRARTFLKAIDQVSIQLCSFTAVEEDCQRVTRDGSFSNVKPQVDAQESAELQPGNKLAVPSCRFSHDIKAYMTERPADIQVISTADITSTSAVASAESLRSIKTGALSCPLFDYLGQCPFGYRCRLLSSHLENVLEGTGYQGSSFRLARDPTKIASYQLFLQQQTTPKSWERGETNNLAFELIKSIRKKQYPLPATEEYLGSIGEPMDQRILDKHGRPIAQLPKSKKSGTASELETQTDAQVPTLDPKVEPDLTLNPQDLAKTLQVDLVRARPSEKRRLIWRDKLYLAPLTTVGNLPFRRLCREFGVDITCSEMALAHDLIGANTNEWSLIKRHRSEKEFGVQIAGSRPQLLVSAAEIISRELDIDFLDLNCGCPIELVFKKGAGAALLEHANKLGKSLVGMSRVLGEIPLTVKLRTGVSENRNLAHKLIPRLQTEWGVGAVTLHGRSRQQRYSKRADWDYIAHCTKVVREAVSDDTDLAPIPIFGNGDCYDYREYYENKEQTGVDGIMIARGALTKPWIFTEIKEHRDWDISSRERLDYIGKLASFGLEHWGSDTQGVNTTRRFLCEALGFQYRYVPVGLLERLPARINDRPFPFRGRDELETLLASGASQDWVKISSMFLGPPPTDWIFTPKHKSNAYDDTEQNG